MSEQPIRGMSCAGLDAAFEAEEARASNLALEAQLLGAQGRPDDAARKYAEVAGIEEALGDFCEEKGLPEKAWVHAFSAVRGWALAGNLWHAIALGEALLARPHLPEPLRQRVREYTEGLRTYRARWSVTASALRRSANGNGNATVLHDAQTGETFLKVPVPAPELVGPALEAVGTLMENLRKEERVREDRK
jgi:hypothetical protein